MAKLFNVLIVIALVAGMGLMMPATAEAQSEYKYRVFYESRYNNEIRKSRADYWTRQQAEAEAADLRTVHAVSRAWVEMVEIGTDDDSSSRPVAESFPGKWTGQWKNSVGESGQSTLFLTKSTKGKYSGTWDGVSVSGKAVDKNTIELQGANKNRSYKITGMLRGRAMTLKYVATRLDKGGKYSGEVSLKGAK